MGNRPLNINHIVRLMSKYLPIRHPRSIDYVDYIKGCNGTQLAYHDRYTDRFGLTLAGHDFWMTCGPLGIRNEQFPDFLLQISVYHLDYQINELVRHIINGRYNNYHQMIPLRDSINRRWQKLCLRRIVDQRKILACESMRRACIVGFDNLEIYLRSRMSQPSHPCDEIPAQPTHVEIRTQLA